MPAYRSSAVSAAAEDAFTGHYDSFMKCLYVAFIASLCATLTWAAPPPSAKDQRWLKTDSKWTRTDSYGVDRDQNGRIDESEWVRVRKSGRAGQGAPWNQPQRPLQDGETHRWTVEWDETFQTQPVETVQGS